MQLPEDFITSLNKTADGEKNVNSLYTITFKTKEIRDFFYSLKYYIQRETDIKLQADLTNAQAKVKQSYQLINDKLREKGIGVREWQDEHPVYLLPNGLHAIVRSVDEAHELLSSAPAGKPLKTRQPYNYSKRSRGDHSGVEDVDQPTPATSRLAANSYQQQTAAPSVEDGSVDE